MSIEFNFVNEDNEIVDNLRNAVGMIAYFDCLKCGFMLHIKKDYNPVPLHYQSILKICDAVTCPKCGTIHHHVIDDEGDGDTVSFTEKEFVDPNQLRLFN